SLAPESPVDALVALLRPGAPHGRLAELAARAGLPPRSLAVLPVLARADEVCGQQPEDWDEALAAAAACQQDPDLVATGQPVTPVIGLLALAAGHLTDDDVAALATLGGDPDRADDALLERLGPFGVRLATSLLRGGAAADRDQLTTTL